MIIHHNYNLSQHCCSETVKCGPGP